ncbi:MAG: general secretion pathway protein GspK [Planctomycetes bacterium]|nr:general secretion pathway protein GspK [Planctomycetota bacterium]
MVGLANHKPRRSALPRKRGALVLVLVLIVVMMLALAGFTFAELMLTENKATRLHGDHLQLQQAIQSGAEQLKLFVEQPRAAQAAAGGAFDNPDLFRAVALRPEIPGTPATANQVRFSVVAPAIGKTFQQRAGVVRFGVENESGRLHLVDLLRYDTEAPDGARKALMQLPRMTETVADAILDWIDPDSEPRPMGAESEYYGGLPQPYAVRNGLPECLEELLLVKGVTRELLFGADGNYNRRLDPDELARQTDTTRPASAEATVPWSWLLTLYSGQRNVNSAGQPRINVNGENLLQLQQQLAAALDPNLAAFVVAYRQYGPYSGAGTPAQGAPPIDASAPPQFTFHSLLDLAGAQVAIPAGKSGEQPQVYASPLPADPRSLAKQLTQLLDLTTVVDLPVSRGLVSVNHAPASVLRAVPGIDEALAQRIIAARPMASGGEEPNRRFATWLFTEGLVDLEAMKRLMPYVTGGGDVVRAQIIAHFNKPTPTARAETIIDATSVPARQILWRDLRFYGPGFPREAFAADSW